MTQGKDFYEKTEEEILHSLGETNNHPHSKTAPLKDHSKQQKQEGKSVSEPRRGRRDGSPAKMRARRRSRSNHSTTRDRSRSSSRKRQPNSPSKTPKPKTPRPEKPKSFRMGSDRMGSAGSRTPRGEKKRQVSSRKLQIPQLPNTPPYATSMPLLVPPDLSSSTFKSINLLVCSANLGNAAPDDDSWNAWIPKDGKLVSTTQFPVRMNPPPAPPSTQKKSQQGQQQPPGSPKSKPRRRGKSKEPSEPRPSNTTLRKAKRNSDPPQQQSYEAYLESLKTNSYSFDQEDSNQAELPEPTIALQSDQGKKPQKEKRSGKPQPKDQNGGDRKLPRRTRSGKSDAEKQLTPKGEPRRGVRRSLSNHGPQAPLTPTQLTRSKTHPNPDPTKSQGWRTPTGMGRRVVRSKSSKEESNEPNKPQATASPRPRLSRRKSLDSATMEAEKSPGSMVRRGRMRSKSPVGNALSRSKSPLRRAMDRARSKSPFREKSVSEIPEPKINQAVISQEEVERIKQIDIRYPANPTNQQDLGFYDIIVIGMQEATFSTSSKKTSDEERSSKHRRESQASTAGSVDDTVEDNSDSDDESEADTIDSGSVGSLTEDGDPLSLENADHPSERGDGDGPSEELKSTKDKAKRKKKRGILKKISKATSKTAKTIDTFAGGGKDHTKRKLRASPTVGGDEEEETESRTLSRTETFSSMDTDDDDFSNLDESGREKVAKEKKWTDTDVLHHALESNQLPEYTRALSYQFGQMRLFVYYKAGKSKSDLLQSVDVLSVGYHATGKAGFANKGGIVAEVAVNKTTKLSFLTAHLEAHEGVKHYKARNDSLQDILMETSNSKYFDASQSSHFTFAMGDLNYRTKLNDVAVGSDRHIQFSHNIVEKRDWRLLNQYDELIRSLSKKLCLSGFKTAYCNFPPTFKVDRQHGYLYNPKRSPSYTDRILFKNSDRLDAATKLLLYEPIEGFTSSDHKPMRSGFSIRLNRELKWKSTAELLLVGEEKKQSKKCIDDFDGIIPATSKGSIEADREIMHFFISNIECVINPSSYDQIRKQEKAELPIPKLLFLAKPQEAFVLPDAGKKRRFGLGSVAKTLMETTGAIPSETEKKPKIPSTPASKETMRPIWKDDQVYFALQTHTEHGRPIDFTGAQLYFSLVDTKNSNSVIGSHCLNLAHLVILSREKPKPANKGLSRSTSHQNVGEQKRLERMGSKRRVGNERPASSRRLNERPISSRKLAGDRQSSSRRLVVERPTSLRHLSMNDSANGKGKPQKRGGPNPVHSSGYQLVPKPSPAMRTVAANVLKLGSNTSSDAKPLPPAVRRAAEAIHRVESGASKLYESIMADLGGGLGKAMSAKKQESDEFQYRSLRLQETLIEGGLVTGHIKCDVDVWWT